MKKIFPKEIIDGTTEVHRFKHRVNSKIIYSILLLSVIGMAIALPFVYLDIYSSSRGVIKSEKERNQIASLYSGRIKILNLKENQVVRQGDTLIIVDNTVGQEKLNLIKNQLDETNLFVVDLEYLSNTQNLSRNKIQSFLYQKQYLQYIQKLRELQTRYSKCKTDFVRQKKLFDKEVIAQQEYENSQYDLDLALSELSYFKKQQRNQWQAELTQQKNNAKELKSTLTQYTEEQSNYIIKSPVNGTIQNLIGLEVGNFITAGNSIAEISPDTDLIAECYVSPSDIGLLKNDNNIKFQIDAYNYNQWGMATGKIIEVGKDITLVNDIPMFKVKCSIDQEQLFLKNGFAGNLKKGMTLNARFFIANRSAFQLLYDKVDDWFNPSKITN
ncbi:HlyD family efflux transporter periplasmic adaptor subunit [Aureibaculum algae]|uniref:HlyD family efflux transporter periplasmic adaptor subunit n=1 Tax=Aureibaculum algae TaxID=2584122 RepID=A0A5B7TRH7_9FLAO|nr:HlyD family efflux transporter periplasmic adaptor subunit [Aureibaculum algae]QCX37567.1 HlyD family efflux transporter periplasmic adaptor subunit [Aureibaculum algae]